MQDKGSYFRGEVPENQRSPLISLKLSLSMMFFPAIICGLLLGLSQIPSGVAHPVDGDASSFRLTLIASDYFPHARGDLSRFDVDCIFMGFNASTQAWATSLDPASANGDEQKAMVMTEAAYIKPFDANDPDMPHDVAALLATIAGKKVPSRF
ncbi:MAG: hypothetical protein M1818_007452 [Claussenomyces sp. TS43310]|nr:MAG: hypothetical protein M1818_007452 [Claussenomyces sp. TS43310]